MLARLLTPLSGLTSRIQGFWIGGGSHLKVILVAVLVLVLLVGGFFGVPAVQAFQLMSQANSDANAHKYQDAYAEMQAAEAKFPLLQGVLGPKISEVSSWMAEDKSLAAARASEKADDYQGCLNDIKNIKSDFPGYQDVTVVRKDCQAKIPAVATATASATPVSSSTGTTTKATTKTTTKTSTTTQTAPSTTTTTTTTTTTPAALASCFGNSYYTVSPIATSDILGIDPLGNLAPSGHTFPTNHLYFYIRKSNPSDLNSAPVQIPFYAPGNVRITDIQYASGSNDYSLIFSPCTQITGKFNHITSLIQSLLDQYNSAAVNWTQSYTTGGVASTVTDKTVSIDVTAGEQLGTAGGRSGQNALDFEAYDTRSWMTFANNSRWTGNLRNAVCALNYFGGLAGTLDGYLNDPFRTAGSTTRTASPICGQIDQDVANTAQGDWIHTGGSLFPEDPNLALVHDNINPSYGAFSIGTSIGNTQGIYYFNPTSSGLVNRDFSQVTADGNVYCYQADFYNDLIYSMPPDIAFLVQMTDANDLQIQKYSANSCGAGPWSFTSPVQFTR